VDLARRGAHEDKDKKIPGPLGGGGRGLSSFKTFGSWADTVPGFLQIDPKANRDCSILRKARMRCEKLIGLTVDQKVWVKRV